MEYTTFPGNQLFGILKLGHCDLFDICFLLLEIFNY
jgi:hypothetical protein